MASLLPNKLKLIYRLRVFDGAIKTFLFRADLVNLHPKQQCRQCIFGGIHTFYGWLKFYGARGNVDNGNVFLFLCVWEIRSVSEVEKVLFSLSDRSTPIPRTPEDEDSFPVLCDRELHSLHRNVPALRRRDVDTATIKQHYYPEGTWYTDYNCKKALSIWRKNKPVNQTLRLSYLFFMAHFAATTTNNSCSALILYVECPGKQKTTFLAVFPVVQMKLYELWRV